MSANPLEAAYRNSLRLARSGKIEMALDGFLDILRQDKHFHDGQLHDIYLALLEVLGKPTQACGSTAMIFRTSFSKVKVCV